jgi:hypothetical protein
MIDRGVGSSNAPAENAADKLTIFINYRRGDTAGQARLLSYELKEKLPGARVYFDVDEAPGIDWLKELKTRGAAAGVFLALIGPQWLPQLVARGVEVKATGEIDYVKREIEWALREWRGVVIPVLVDTQMPSVVSLPGSIEGLARKQGVPLRHAAYEADVAHLVDVLSGIASGTAIPEDLPPEPVPLLARSEALSPAAGVPAPTDDHYISVIKGMLRGTVVPLLGPSVRGALPDARQLASRLAEQFDLSGGSSDLAEIAQHVAVTEGEAELYDAVAEIVAAGAQPTPVHRFLAEFPGLLREHNLTPRPQLIISTNYDGALESAFEDAGEPFDYAFYSAGDGIFVHFACDDTESERKATRIDSPRTYQGFPIDDRKVQRTIIVKIHGAPDEKFRALIESDSYVITEDHYIDYLPGRDIHDSVPVQILEKLTGGRRLFLGYTLRDWNARMVLKRIWQEKTKGGSSWAIVCDPDPFEKSLWTRVEGVELWSASSVDYIDGLRAVLTEQLKHLRASPVAAP